MPSKSSNRRSRRSSEKTAARNDWERRNIPSMQLHESEKLLVGILAFLLVMLPWSLGSTHLPAQAIAAFIAMTALGAALLPRHGNTHSITSSGQFKRLLTFPGFWLGGLLLGLVLIQGLNTAWKVEGTEEFRLLTESDHLSWLPAGVEGSGSGPFRWLLILGTPLAALCAAWIGITRRKSVLVLLGTASINGAALAAIAFYQIFKNKSAILGFHTPATDKFFATFPYHWQGAAYLVLVLAASLGLAAHHFAQSRRTFKRSNPSGLFVFIGLILTLMAIFSSSLTAAALAGGLMVAFLAHIAYRELTANAYLSRKILLFAVAVIATLGGTWIGRSIADDFLTPVGRADEPIPGIATAADWNNGWAVGGAMLRERPLFGWGAGGFPIAYAEVAQRHDIPVTSPPQDAEFASSDWIRLPAEFGIIGTLLLLLTGGVLLRHYFDRRVFENPLIGFLLLGSVSGLLLGLASLTFHNVAFLTTWTLVLAFGAILVRIERTLRTRDEQPAD